MALFITAITSSLNPDIEKYNFIKEQQYQVEFLNQEVDSYEGLFDKSHILSSDYDFFSKTYLDRIKEEIESISYFRNNSDLGTDSINPKVINNSINIIDSISPSLMEKINIDDIYPSKYGTIILEWNFDDENIFSLEVGKNSIGYFCEIAGDISKEVDSLSIKDINFNSTITNINTDLAIFA